MAKTATQRVDSTGMYHVGREPVETSKKMPGQEWGALTVTRWNATEYLNWIILEDGNRRDLISVAGVQMMSSYSE